MTTYEDVVLPMIRQMEQQGMSWREIEEQVDAFINMQNLVEWVVR